MIVGWRGHVEIVVVSEYDGEERELLSKKVFTSKIEGIVQNV